MFNDYAISDHISTANSLYIFIFISKLHLKYRYDFFLQHMYWMILQFCFLDFFKTIQLYLPAFLHTTMNIFSIILDDRG